MWLMFSKPVYKVFIFSFLSHEKSHDLQAAVSISNEAVTKRLNVPQETSLIYP